MAVKKDPKKGKIYFVPRVMKADTALAVKDILLAEDDFATFYVQNKNADVILVEPPFNPSTLLLLTNKNNVLSQCIAAMEVNIDGTGASIEPIDEKEAKDDTDPKEKRKAEAFFNEPFPETSFITIRRKLRWDLEATGNAYLEVIRNAAGEVVFLRWLDVALMRMAKLDGAVQVDKEVERDGQVLKFPMWMRERRFVQKIGTEMIFFKEFGSSRDLNRKTGRWAEQGVQLKLEDKASEVIHFTLERDVGTAYGLPRWINQLPSVLGSRKAEEFNLEFFDNGGVPPAVVFLQGGALVEDVKEQLLGYFSGKAAYRVAVVEVQSSTGSIDSTGTVQVKTERFGDTKADAMFTTYDTSTEEHVRVGFRLPPLFLGRAQDYNFATAMTAYMVTEAQVFAPERTEFDEIINKKLLKALGIKNYKYVSKPVTLKNVEVQLQAIELAADKIDGEKMIETINDIAGLNLEYSKEAHEEAKKLGKPDAFMEGGPFGGPAPTKEAAKGLKPGVNPKSAKVIPLRKNELGPDDVVALVNQWAIAAGLERGQTLVDEEKARIFKAVDDLSPAQRSLFDNVLATKSFLGVGHDPSGMAAIASCCADMVK